MRCMTLPRRHSAAGWPMPGSVLPHRLLRRSSCRQSEVERAGHGHGHGHGCCCPRRRRLAALTGLATQPSFATKNSTARSGCSARNRPTRRPTLDRPCVRIKPALISSHLGWGTIAVPSDEPSFVVASGELDGAARLFDGVEVLTHSRFSFKVRMKRSATPLPSGCRTKEGEASIPRHSISSWKSPDM